MQDLKRELQHAIEDAIIGEPLRPGLAGRAKTAAMNVLYRHRIRGGRVNVHQRGAGDSVALRLPAAPQRLQRAVVSVG